MIIDIDEISLPQYNFYKKDFFDRVKNGYREKEVKLLKEHGGTEDEIFIAHLLGLYLGIRECQL